MDTYLTIASRREVRDYAQRPIPDDVVHRILDAGSSAGRRATRGSGCL
jgi:nitroreductase